MNTFAHKENTVNSKWISENSLDIVQKKNFFFYLDYLNKFKIFLTSDISYDKKIIFDISEMIWVIIHVPAYQYYHWFKKD